MSTHKLIDIFTLMKMALVGLPAVTRIRVQLCAALLAGSTSGQMAPFTKLAVEIERVFRAIKGHWRDPLTQCLAEVMPDCGLPSAGRLFRRKSIVERAGVFDDASGRMGSAIPLRRHSQALEHIEPKELVAGA